MKATKPNTPIKIGDPIKNFGLYEILLNALLWWDKLSESEQNDLIDEHFGGGECLKCYAVTETDVMQMYSDYLEDLLI